MHSLENWNDDVYSAPASGGEPRLITQDRTLNGGLAWLPDGSGIVYSSARGSTLLYLPTMHLWLTPATGGQPHQLTFGDSGDESPDIDPNWRVVSSRKHMEFDIWKIPVTGDPAENVSHAMRITHQTGQVQTPRWERTTGKSLTCLTAVGTATSGSFNWKRACPDNSHLRNPRILRSGCRSGRPTATTSHLPSHAHEATRHALSNIGWFVPMEAASEK